MQEFFSFKKQAESMNKNGKRLKNFQDIAHNINEQTCCPVHHPSLQMGWRK